MTYSIKLGTILGIPIEIDYTWFVIFVLITLSLATDYFPIQFPHMSKPLYWLAGALAAILLYFSVLVHELSHCLVARRNSLEIKKITFFIFGGIAQMTSEPESPAVEFKMAVAGPLASIVLSLIFYGASELMLRMDGIVLLYSIFYYLYVINIALAVFNLMPAFPLDGGRVFRAILWKYMNNLNKATKIASMVGQAFGFLLIFSGLYLIMKTSNLMNGLWFIFLGWFLNNAAQSSFQQLILRRALTGEKVSDIMTTDVTTVPYNLTVDEFVNSFLLKHKYIAYPVMDGDTILGIITLHQAKHVPLEKRTAMKLADVMTPVNKDLIIESSAELSEALVRMGEHDLGRLLVTDNGKLAGILSRSDILKTMQIKTELER